MKCGCWSCSHMQKRKKPSKVLQRLKHQQRRESMILSQLLLAGRPIGQLLNKSHRVRVSPRRVILSLLIVCLIPRVKVQWIATNRSVVDHFNLLKTVTAIACQQSHTEICSYCRLCIQEILVLCSTFICIAL